MAFRQEHASILDRQTVMLADLIGGVNVGSRTAGDVKSNLMRALGTFPIQIGATERLEFLAIVLGEILGVQERDPPAVVAVADLQCTATEVSQLVGPHVFCPEVARIAGIKLGQVRDLHHSVIQIRPDSLKRPAAVEVAFVVVHENPLNADSGMGHLFRDLLDEMACEVIGIINDVWQFGEGQCCEGLESPLQDEQPRVVVFDGVWYDIGINVVVDERLEFVPDTGQYNEKFSYGLFDGDGVRRSLRRHIAANVVRRHFLAIATPLVVDGYARIQPRARKAQVATPIACRFGSPKKTGP